jgi:hypothetical protein
MTSTKVNGKNKGNSFERAVSLTLSERFKTVTRIEKSFRRNPDSGSYWGATNQKRIETHDTDHANFGDLLCPKNFKFSVECKAYKSGPSFASIVKGKVTQWDEWISQATQDAKNAKLAVLLIIKYNGTDIICFVSNNVPHLQPILLYNGMFGYRFKDFLNQTDDMFFVLDSQ